MPIFLSDEEYERCSHDVTLVVEKADAFVKQLLNQLETVKAEADAASITAEQTCSLIEQKYVTLSAEFSSLQSQNSQLVASLDERASQVAQLQTQKDQIHLQSIGKDGEIERVSTEASELHKSKRQLMALIEQKDIEISEKNATIKSYLDKIVNLTENAAAKEARLSDLESQLVQSEAFCTRLSQEKELLERHTSWLNDELEAKVGSLIEVRNSRSELEAEMFAKLADMEKRFYVTSSSLTWNQDRVRELESQLASLEQELLSSKDVAAAAEKQFSAEISTLTKLVELYKESSEEWSKKAGELDGVIKALETHLKHVENDYKERLEKEVSSREEIEKEAKCLKEKLDKCEAELESYKKKDELGPLPLSSFSTDSWIEPVEKSGLAEQDRMLVSGIPTGVSGTALAASLLRDGWSLAKIYSKYQEAIDALRHEQLGRKQAQAVLDRVLYEIEEKAALIQEERAEHEKVVEAYSLLNQKVQHFLAKQTTSDTQIQELKAELKKHERHSAAAEKEITDLQKQVVVLLKECRDIQLRCGYIDHNKVDALLTGPAVYFDDEYAGDNGIPVELLAFKDIVGLVEQNVQLRRLVRRLSEEIEDKENELKEEYSKELQKHTDEASSKINSVLARAEEQGCMIESLHTSVAMYKKLYEEKKFHSSDLQPHEPAELGRKDFVDNLDSSNESSRRAEEQILERVKYLEEEAGRLRIEIISIRSERDKLALEAQLSRERFERLTKEFEHQRDEHNGVLARNIEFQQLIIDYQQKMRESSEALNAAEELSRKLKMEISIVKQEKEIVQNAGKRASDEIRNLSERAHRLQASLDTLQSTEEVREEARCAERRKLEEYIKQIEREWAEAKKELHEERVNAQNLALERENSMSNALKQVEEMRRELADALRALSAAETRALVAEGQCSDLVEKMKSSHFQAFEKDPEIAATSSADIQITVDQLAANEEIEKLREEARINKEHMLQYKRIAEANEEALKHLEITQEDLKAEAEKVKKSLEGELLSLKGQVNELEVECNLKSKEVASATAEKEEAIAAAMSNIARLKEEYSIKMSEYAVMETQFYGIKDDLEHERQKSRAAQVNYERQVILQSETIQELTRTSQALATVQEEASELRELADALKTENNELKVKSDTEKSVLEVLKNDTDRKYNEANELNKILHNRLDSLHIKLAEKEHHSSAVSGGTQQVSSCDDDGMQNVVKYLRRSKEIAETEISLLKQEKYRLQSQLETALKAAEVAQASLNTERANSKALLFTDEEFKSLQLQVREISLLRESNMQLREENRHNFEECKKLRESFEKATLEADALARGLEDGQNEVEACKKEIERQKMEKEDLRKQVNELLERCKSFDVEDYERKRAAVEQMQVNLAEAEAHLEEFKKLCTEKQDMILLLEQDLNRSRMELSDRGSRINELLQAEASLKSEVEKQKRMLAQLKKKNENLSKEKEDLAKENQSLSKQLEDARQAKRIVGDAASEQALKEKEKEKDTRIQILEKTVERLREELRKEKDEFKREKDKRLRTQKTIGDSYEKCTQQRSMLSDELEKHKQGLKTLTDEVEKLKLGKDSQSEGTSELNFLAGTLLEDLISAYHLAVEDFERIAQELGAELGCSIAETSSSLDNSSSVATMGQAVSTMAPSILSPAPPMTNTSASKSPEREKKFILPKTNPEARKTGRKLVRPRIMKPEDSQGDVEMSEVEAPDSSVKPSPSNNTDSQGNLTFLGTASVRKRPPTSSASVLREDPLAPGETSSDVGPMLKKSKNLDGAIDSGEGQPLESGESQSAVNLEDPEGLHANEEAFENIADLPHGFKESSDANKDDTHTSGKQEDPTFDVKQEEFENDRNDHAEENLNMQNELLISDDPSKVQAEQDILQPTTESGSEREEGELVADIVDPDGGCSTSNTMASPEPGEVLSEHTMVSDNPPGQDEETSNVGIEAGELDSFHAIGDVKKHEGNTTEDISENPDKLNDNNEQPAVEMDEASEPSITQAEKTSVGTGAELGAPRQAGPGPTATVETGEKQPVGRSSRTINLHQRARERASIRQAGMLSSSTSRGRGRLPQVRGGRSRGQSSGKQG